MLLSVVEGFALCFISSSQVLRTPLKWGFTHPALLCVLLEPLGYKEAAENEGAQS